MDFSQHTGEQAAEWYARIVNADRSNLSKSEREYLDRCINTALYRSGIEERARSKKPKEGAT